MLRYSLVFLLASLLCACAPFRPNDGRAAICNELNSKLIFGGGTSDNRKAEIQNAEEPLVQHSYEKNRCDQ